MKGMKHIKRRDVKFVRDGFIGKWHGDANVRGYGKGRQCRFTGETRIWWRRRLRRSRVWTIVGYHVDVVLFYSWESGVD